MPNRFAVIVVLASSVHRDIATGTKFGRLNSITARRSNVGKVVDTYVAEHVRIWQV
jgi:hypothetical protein